jgi:YggT family protein
MLFQILSLLLDVAASLVGGACLLRLYMQWQRVPFGNPLGRFVFAVSNWLVLPLRRLLPAMGRLDTASLLAAWAVELVQLAALWSLSGALGGALGMHMGGGSAGGLVSGPAWALLPVLAIFGLARLVLSSMTAMVLLGAILSWVRADSDMADLVDRLCVPLLAPLRRVIPLVGGLDLTPLAMLVLLQIAGIVLSGLQVAVLG